MSNKTFRITKTSGAVAYFHLRGELVHCIGTDGSYGGNFLRGSVDAAIRMLRGNGDLIEAVPVFEF